MNTKRKSITEQISEINKQIENLENRIKKDTERKDALKKEMETLQSLEVKAMIKELNMPVDEIKRFLLSMQQKNIAADSQEKPEVYALGQQP